MTQTRPSLMTKIYSLILATSVLFVIGCGSDSTKTEGSKIKNTETSEVKSVEQSSMNETQLSDPITENEDNVIVNTSPESETNLEPTTSTKVSIEKTIGTAPTERDIQTSPDPIQIIEETEKIDIHKYEKLNFFLKKYVSASGKVNYSGIKANKGSLDSILKEIESNYQKNNWTNNQKLAYWINVYNIYTIKLVVDNYPTTSITKVTAEPWKKKFINLGGSTLSLAHVENEIIRKKFNEPRIHFALNCASKSCPNLMNAAYTPSNLQSKLTSQTKKFLNAPSKNKFEKKEISISKIFDWYSTDFTKNGTIKDFINKYRTEQLSSEKITYMEYSWDLNN
ncbi:MAG: hypothetical protein ACJA0U_003283 [Salibacteraceae bacterium]|jgi:hypothetical protein